MASIKKKVGRPSKQVQASLASDSTDKHFVYYKGKEYDNSDGSKFVIKPEVYDSFKPKELQGIFDFTIKESRSILNNITLSEPIDKHLLEKCINSNEVSKLTTHYLSKDCYTNLKQQLASYYDKILNGKVKVNYTIPTKACGFGRVSPAYSLSLGVFRREVRHALAKAKYVDIDIENAQVQMLYQFCKAHELPCQELENYCNNRQEYLDKVANAFKKADGTPLNVKLENGKYKYRDDIKSLFIILIFFGGFRRWQLDKNIDSSAKREDCKAVDDFYKELMKVSNTIMFHNKKFFNIVNDGEHLKTKKDEDGIVVTYENHMGRAMSIFLQDLERQCIECVYQYLTDIGVITNYECVYCFDGLMVMKDKWNDSILEDLSKVVKDKLGFELKFTVKAFDEGEDILNSFKNIEIPQEAKDKFNKVYFDSLDTYTDKKLYFERFFCKVRDNSLIYQLYFNVSNCKTVDEENERNADTILYECSKFTSSWNDLRFTRYNPKTDCEEEAFFVKEWLVDTNIKVSQNIEFNPINKSETQLLDYNDEEEFRANLFTGYSDKILKPFTKGKFIKPWLNLLTELCEGNVKYRDYVINLLATKIQNPKKKLPVGLVIMGSQGTGKNTWLNSVGRVIGDRHYISSSKCSDFFGEHAEGFANKLLVNMNEVEGKDTMDLQGRMKEFITEDKITVNMKFIRPIPIKNYALLVLFSNKSNPIQIDVKSGDRRWVVFKSTDKLLDKKKYGDTLWTKLNETFMRDEFVAELYDFLNTRDLSKFNAVRERPLTESYKQLCFLSIPKEVLFLEYLFTKQKWNVTGELGNRKRKLENELCDVERRLIERFSVELENKANQLKDELDKVHREHHPKILLRNESYIGAQMYKDFLDFCEENNLLTKDNKISVKKFYSDFMNLNCGIQKGIDSHCETTTLFFNYGKVFKSLYERSPRLSYMYVYGNGEEIELEKEKEEAEVIGGTDVDSFFEDL